MKKRTAQIRTETPAPYFTCITPPDAQRAHEDEIIGQALAIIERRHHDRYGADNITFTAPGTAIQHARLAIGGREHETFVMYVLDSRHRLMAVDELFRGSIDSATIHPREVVKAALARNAGAVIFAHNHPSGVAEPSAADGAITRRLQDALALVDIRVLDHVVVTATDGVSMANLGMC